MLLRVVKAKIALDWSPEQIAAWLKLTYPGDATMRLSHEAIYRSAATAEMSEMCITSNPEVWSRQARPCRRYRI